MKFLICEQQHGEGCDYMIGCGMRYYWVEADSIEDAKEKIFYPEGLDEYSSLEGDKALKNLLIIPAEAVNDIDLVPILAKIKDDREKEKNEEKRNKDLEELRRLQQEYPDS